MQQPCLDVLYKPLDTMLPRTRLLTTLAGKRRLCFGCDESSAHLFCRLSVGQSGVSEVT